MGEEMHTRNKKTIDRARIGIIDIGSNSIRLAIYEMLGDGCYRVIDESKQTMRLSHKVRDDGSIPLSTLADTVHALKHFRAICNNYRVYRIRAAATAAIRNAANRQQILRKLRRESGLSIEVLSGKDEAYYGFLGVANTLDVRDGWLVDIGGGSTEVTLIQNRRIVRSVSFPFGAANAAKRFTDQGQLTQDGLGQLRRMVAEAIDGQPWIRRSPGLPLIGVGGAFRSMARLHQRARRYSLPQVHHYRMKPSDSAQIFARLQPLKVAQLRKLNGISKDRADIIVPGFALVNAMLQETAAKELIISGSGLRDGLFFATIRPEAPLVDNLLEQSIRQLLSMHAAASDKHLAQVERLALRLFDDLQPEHGLDRRCRTLLQAASQLFRTGVSVHYYHYQRHTFYMLANTPIYGLTHREILITALVASFKSRSRCRNLWTKHADILSRDDLDISLKLGTLLRTAIALDRSNMQLITHVSARTRPPCVLLRLQSRGDPAIELLELESAAKEFRKVWGLSIKAETVSSTS